MSNPLSLNGHFLSAHWNYRDEAHGIFLWVQAGKMTEQQGHDLILMSEDQRAWLVRNYPYYTEMIHQIYRARKRTDEKFGKMCETRFSRV